MHANEVDPRPAASDEPLAPRRRGATSSHARFCTCGLCCQTGDNCSRSVCGVYSDSASPSVWCLRHPRDLRRNRRRPLGRPKISGGESICDSTRRLAPRRRRSGCLWNRKSVCRARRAKGPRALMARSVSGFPLSYAAPRSNLNSKPQGGVL